MDTTAKPCCAASRSRQEQENNSTFTPEFPKQNSKEIRFKDRMVFVKGGEFLMGADSGEGHPADLEGPVRKQRVEPFYLDRAAVTNEEFLQFTQETGYQTEVQKYGWSFVSEQFISPEIRADAKRVAGTPWWCAVEEAYWFQPEGPGSGIENRMDHPVVHVSWTDAIAYCKWAGKRLPNEAEWEYAARGGLEQKRYPWGDELNPNGEPFCNIWQGTFPVLNTAADGYSGTAPATSFPPNNFGFFNMSGNVWEWCSNAFAETSSSAGPDAAIAMRGGSYLCHESYCNRHRVAARSSNTSDSSAGNIGFRCAVSV